MSKNNKKVVLFSALLFSMISLLLIKNTLYKGTSALIDNNSSYLPRDNNGNIITRPLGEGVENVFLSFFTNVGDSVDPQLGSKSALDAYKNVITYVDNNGQVTDNVFMDTFLFTPQANFISKSHNVLFSTFENAYNGLQTYEDDIANTLSHLTKDENGLYVEDGYYILAEINKMKVVDDYLTRLNNQYGYNIKINTIMTMGPMMDKLREGQFGDSNSSSSVTALKNKGWVVSNSVVNAAIDSYVDKSISLFNSANFKNLNLIGMYWIVETQGMELKVSGYNNYIYYDTTKDREHFNQYVHSKGLKTLQVPYIHSNADKSDSSLDGYLTGMNFVSIQTGYFWKSTEKPINNTNKNRLEFVDMVTHYGTTIENNSNKTIKKGIGAGVEVEADYNLYGEIKYCNNYKTWLNYAINHGWDKSLKIYYITEVFANNKVDWINHRLYAREIYDATYKYAMGTLTQSDVNNLCVEKDTINYELISTGKSYETVPFKNANGNNIYETGNKYEEDGIKLTDGIYGKSAYSDYKEWVGFNKNINSSNYYIVVDLEKVRASLNHFAIEFSDHNNDGIGRPNGNISIYISNDNINFRKIGEAVSYGRGFGYYYFVSSENNKPIYRFRYELNLDNYENGRYVKFEFDKGKSAFEFVSEVEVGKAKGEKNKVQVQYNINGGIFDEEYNTNYNIFDSLITYNGNTILSTFDYDGELKPKGLLNYNNPNYVNIVRDGYSIPAKSEWYIINNDGSKTYFDQSNKYYLSSNLCDASGDDCVVTVYANWIINELTFEDQTLDSGTYGTVYTSNVFTGASNGSGSYTYTIKSGAPDGATIDSINRTISFTSTTTPGTYNVVVTAKDSNTNKTKDATMTIIINKKSSTLSLSSTSGTLTYGTIGISTIITDSDGKLSCSTSDNSVATCSISNEVLTIIPQANIIDEKTATIKVTQAAGTNYSANTIGVTYSAIVNRKLLTCPSSPADKIYSGSSQASGISCPIGSTAGGNQNETNASDNYTQTCIADSGYKFSKSCSVLWKIKKYTPSVELNPTTGTVNANSETTFTATPTVITACKGILTAASADTSKITITGGASTENATSAVTVTWKGIDYTPDTKINVNYSPSDNNNCNSAAQVKYTSKVNKVSSDDSIVFSENNEYYLNGNILYQIMPNMTTYELINTVKSNGVLNILDKDDNILTESINLRTGYKLRATFTTNVLEYKLSIKGDVLGTGELSRANAEKIAKHVIDKNIISGEEYLLAADYNNDDIIKMNDAIKILRELKQGNH